MSSLAANTHPTLWTRSGGCVTGNTCFFPLFCESLAQVYPVDRSTRGLCRNNENISLVAYLSADRSGAALNEGYGNTEKGR